VRIDSGRAEGRGLLGQSGDRGPIPRKRPQPDGRSHYDMILWRTQASLRQHRPRGGVWSPPTCGMSPQLRVRIDSNERLPVPLPQRGRRAGPPPYALVVEPEYADFLSPQQVRCRPQRRARPVPEAARQAEPRHRCHFSLERTAAPARRSRLAPWSDTRWTTLARLQSLGGAGPCERGLCAVSGGHAVAAPGACAGTAVRAGWPLEARAGRTGPHTPDQLQDFCSRHGVPQPPGRNRRSQGHHPDFCLKRWNQVSLLLTTHAIGGLSHNNFVVAAKLPTAIRPPSDT
jgi:hypothetical protein